MIGVNIALTSSRLGHNPVIHRQTEGERERRAGDILLIVDISG